MTTQTEATLADLRAEYEGLEDKRSSKARALRAEIELLEPSEAPPASEQLSPRSRGRPGAKRIEASAITKPAAAAASGVGLKSAMYWIGTFPVGQAPDPENPYTMVDDPDVRPYPPFTYTIIGGFSFPQFIEPIISKDKQNGDQTRGRFNGELIQLNEEQVTRIADEMGRTYIRWRRKEPPNVHASRITLPSERDIAAAKRDAKAKNRDVILPTPDLYESDEPISKYVYIVKAVERSGTLPLSAARAGIDLP